MKRLMILLIILCFSCSASRTAVETTKCNENLAFKKEFFYNIQNIETLITKEQNESFHNSLNFLAKYTHVSFETMLNYSDTYSIPAFEKDKKGWLIWYEENKCKNIQFR